MITFSILKQCPIFFRGRNLSNLWDKHLILVGYSVGLNLNHSTKTTKSKVERIASAPLFYEKHPYINLNELIKPFCWKTPLTAKAVIYVVICQGCKEEYIGETGCLVKERINIYRQHIRQPQYQQLAVEEHLRTCGYGKFHSFPFFEIIQENKSLRKSYEDYFNFCSIRSRKTS